MADQRVFERSGLAALSDLQTEEWRQLFETLEQEQQAFLLHEPQFRSAEYRWPRDPLHNWSRVWEYPFAYSCLRRWRDAWREPSRPTVLDVGSGVTFFPFAVAKLGAEVCCLDVDPVCERDLSRAIEVVDGAPGRVRVSLTDPHRLPCDDAGADAIYCISVLEHVDEFERLVEDMARVLRPGGILILTMDLDLREEGWALDARQCERLRRTLSAHFEALHAERSVHPADLLVSDSGPYGFEDLRAIPAAWFHFRQQVLKRLLGRRPYRWPPFHLAVMALALRKPAGA